MTKFLAAAVAAAALAAVAGQAQAATSPEQRIAALEQQVATLAHALAARPLATPDPRVATLQKKEAALEKRVKALEANLKKAQTALTQTQSIAALGVIFAACSTAATADAFTSTWNVIDQISTATQAGKVYFGPQAAVSDFQTCQTIQITRQQGTVPPTVAVFSALTTLLGRR
jgi:hypothetical protein